MQVGHPNGAVVPVDEPAVAAARADHLSALAATHGVAHAVAPPVPAVAHAAPVVATGYAGPLNLNTALVGHPNGAVVPVDEPAVAAARADHLAAVGAHVAPVAVAPAVPAVAPVAAPVVATGYAGPLNLNTHLVAHPNGAVVPADEHAVAAARADHLAAGGAVYAAAYLAHAALPALAACLT